MYRQIRKDTVERMYPHQLMQCYMLASYCYYELAQSPMTDDAFDYLCIRLLEVFDNFEHEHKQYTDKDSLIAGTCLLARDKYPLRVITAADQFMEDISTGKYFQMIEPVLMPSKAA